MLDRYTACCIEDSVPRLLFFHKDKADSFRLKLSLLRLDRSIQALPSLFPSSDFLLLASDLLVKSFEICVTSQDEG